MTVSTATRSDSFPGAGSVGPYTVDWKVLSTADVQVTQVDANGVRTALSTPADYAITLTSLGVEGASITLTTALPVGETLVIEGNTVIQQPTNYANQGSFKPETHENSFDRLTLIAKESRERVDRSAQLPAETSFSGTLFLPEPSAGKAIVWNSGGTALVNSDANVSDIDALATQVAADAAQVASDKVGTAADVVAAEAARDAALAAVGGVAVSANDTTPANLSTKLSSSDSVAVFTENNDGGNETYTLAIDQIQIALIAQEF